jgi:hypothetical protein
MAIAALSTAGFSQYIALTSNVGASAQAWQSLQQSLAAGNLSAAQSAFNTYQKVSQNGVSSSSNSNSQLANDIKALGSALGSGNLSDSQQAFATVQSDLKGQPPMAVQSAESAVAQTVNEVDALLSFPDAGNTLTTAVDPAVAILDSAYGLTSSSNTTDPDLALLEAHYGASATAGASGNSASSAAPNVGNAGSGATVNAYA